MKNVWILAAAEGETIESTTITEADGAAEQGLQAIEGQDGSPQDQATGKPKSFPPIMFLMVGVIVIMYVFMITGNRKKQKKRQNMLKEINKNDRIRTIGGIFGTVIDVSDGIITLKVDESNNTKIKISEAAVADKLSE